MGLFDSLFGGGDSEKVKVPPLNLPTFDSSGAITRQAQVNRVNQITPYGSLTFSGPDRNTLNFNLSPEMQALFQSQSAFGTNAANAGNAMLGSVPGSADAATQAILARLQPQFQRQDQQLRSRLEQSGNPAAYGSQAMAPGAFNELALQNQSQNDARLAAVLGGAQYQQTLAQTAAGLGNASPIGVPQYQFQGATPVDTYAPTLAGYNAQVQGALQNQQLQTNAGIANAQNAQQQNSGILGGLFDLGVAGIGAMTGNPFASFAALGGGGGGGLMGGLAGLGVF